VKKNKGVEIRNMADLQKGREVLDSKNKLLEKARLYEKLSTINKRILCVYFVRKGENGVNSKEGLIDFQQKKIDSEPLENKKEYETQRKKFYEEKKREIEEREKEIIEKKIQHAKGDLYKEIDRSESERIQWEKQAFKEIEEGITEESIIFLSKLREIKGFLVIMMNANKKNVVLQVYDKVLSKNEKE